MVLEMREQGVVEKKKRVSKSKDEKGRRTRSENGEIKRGERTSVPLSKEAFGSEVVRTKRELEVEQKEKEVRKPKEIKEKTAELLKSKLLAKKESEITLKTFDTKIPEVRHGTVVVSKFSVEKEPEIALKTFDAKITEVRKRTVVPKLHVEKEPEIKIKDFDASIPSLWARKRDVLRFPSIKISDFKHSVLKTFFDTKIHVRRESEAVLVPKISVMNMHSALKTVFDKRLSALERKNEVVPVPKISIMNTDVVMRRDFDELVVLRRKIREEETRAEKEIKGAAEGEELGEEEFLDILFESVDEKYNIKGILSTSAERPIIILAEKVEGNDYIDALKLILREIYRIKVGGFPKVMVTKKDNEEVEGARAEGRIHIIDDDLSKFFEFFNVKNAYELKESVDMEKLLEERMEELFAQGFGFLVFYLKKDNLEFLRNSLGTKEQKIPKLIIVRGREQNEEEMERISGASFGFAVSEPPRGKWKTLSDYFSGYEKEFYNKLEKLSSTKYAIFVRESVEDEEGEGKESSLHYLLKIFLVMYLKEKLKLENVKIEEEIERGVIPDIFVPSKNLAIEVETLYGTGVAILRKIGRTVEKYKGRGYELWVVMPNLQLLMFKKHLKEIKKAFNDEIKLEFYGVDLSKHAIISLNDL